MQLKYIRAVGRGILQKQMLNMTVLFIPFRESQGVKHTEKERKNSVKGKDGARKM